MEGFLEEVGRGVEEFLVGGGDEEEEVGVVRAKL